MLTKEAFFDVVWPETAVSDVVLKVCIHELRHALEDNARQPRFIETVGTRPGLSVHWVCERGATTCGAARCLQADGKTPGP